MKKNKVITCKIVGFQDYGMFVNCGEYEGLVHISEISDQYINSIEQIFMVGDLVDLLVLEVCDENRLKLSYKRNHHIHKKIVKSVPMKSTIQNKKGEFKDKKQIFVLSLFFAT